LKRERIPLKEKPSPNNIIEGNELAKLPPAPIPEKMLLYCIREVNRRKEESLSEHAQSKIN